MEEENIQMLSKKGMRVTEADWHSFRKKVFFEIQERFVREEGRRLLPYIMETKY